MNKNINKYNLFLNKSVKVNGYFVDQNDPIVNQIETIASSDSLYVRWIVSDMMGKTEFDSKRINVVVGSNGLIERIYMDSISYEINIVGYKIKFWGSKYYPNWKWKPIIGISKNALLLRMFRFCIKLCHKF